MYITHYALFIIHYSLSIVFLNKISFVYVSFKKFV